MFVTGVRRVLFRSPMVSENDELPDERKAVTEYAQKLQTEIFPDLKVAFVHGKMKAKEKDAFHAPAAAKDAPLDRDAARGPCAGAPQRQQNCQ